MYSSLNKDNVYNIRYFGKGSDEMYKKEMTLTFEQVNEYIAYDPETGIFTWRKSPHRRFKVGSEAGRGMKSLRTNTRSGVVSGYKYIGLHGVQTPAARIAWLLTHGEWPKGSLLFKDDNPMNLRLGNLKEADFPTDKVIKEGKPHYKMSKNAKRHYGLKRYYGMSPETYNVMLASQGGTCDICKGTETYQPKNYEGPKALSVDHNHATGQIRGLLCSRCNYVIGFCKEDRNVLLEAIKYLDKHSGRESAKPTLTVVPSEDAQ